MSFVERQEGREFARSVFVSVLGFGTAFFESNGIQTVLENLEETVKQHRGDYAEGMKEIIQLARKATRQEAN